MDKHVDIHIFRAGTHRSMQGAEVRLTAADLAEVAAAYDPARHEAPVVIGHPAADAPAWGWVRRLRVEGDDLIAEATDLDPAFAELVRAGRFRKVSASFYLKGHPANPAGEAIYLKHVGFLGAQPPAVKGLRQVAFAQGEGDLVSREVSFCEACNTDPQHKESGMPDPEDKTREAEFAERQATLAAREAEIAAREEAARQKEAAFAEREAAEQVAADKAVLDRLVEEGRLAPGARADLAAFMEGIGATGEVSFAEGAQPPRQWFRDFLGKHAGKLIEFRELSADDTDRGAAGQPGSVEALTARAQKLVKDAADEGRALNFAEAVRRAEAELEG
jgi:hypothetical protein